MDRVPNTPRDPGADLDSDRNLHEPTGTARVLSEQLGAATLPFDPTNYLIRGSTWFLALRWSIRSIGLFSTIILARLLTPEDFGLITMATH